MKAREYNVRIEVWEVGQRVSDGFGGWVIGDPVKITTTWSKLETNGLGRKAYNLGLIEFNDPLLFLVRGRNDLPYNGRNLYLMYRNVKYIIKSVRNEDMRDVDTEIFCIREEPETVPFIGVAT
jgi:hypothetical protein